MTTCIYDDGGDEGEEETETLGLRLPSAIYEQQSYHNPDPAEMIAAEYTTNTTPVFFANETAPSQSRSQLPPTRSWSTVTVSSGVQYSCECEYAYDTQGLGSRRAIA